MPKLSHFAAAISLLALAESAFVFGAHAQATNPIPPANALKLSDIVAKIERRPGFQYIEQVQWFNCVYIITFFTTDKAKVEIHIDPVTGQPR